MSEYEEKEIVSCDGTSMIYSRGEISLTFPLSDPDFVNLKPGMWRMDEAVIWKGRKAQETDYI